jgi:branched-chain amino acid transport system permease protein
MSELKTENILIGITSFIILGLVWQFFGLNANDLINVSILGVLCIGFTFTYMMDGFPNFAHTSYAIIGAITSFYLTRFYRFNPYDTWPFSILVGGTLGVLLYIMIVRPIKQRGGNQSITLTFTFFAISTILGSLSYIFSYWVSRVAYSSQEYNLSNRDFWLHGKPGIVWVGVGTCLMIALYLYYFLTKTTTGISLRAISENEELAESLGINSYRTHCLAWFISGGLAALAGSIIVLNQGLSPEDTDVLMILVMTGSIFGGLDSVFGALVGGVFIAVAQKVLATILFWFFGLSVLTWVSIYPMVFLVITLFFFPNGLMDRRNIQNKWIREIIDRISAERPESSDF